MKRLLAVFMVMGLLLTLSAQAEPAQGKQISQSQRWANGIVKSVESEDVFAPLGGQVQSFSLEAGDRVEAGAQLLSIRPAQVLAPANGVVRLLKAEVGDQAAAVIQQYGGLCFIDREDTLWVRATTATAYDKPANRAIVLGETLRVYDSDAKVSAPGTVVMADGSAYVVEIPAGIFDLEDKVRLYRGQGVTYSSKEKVGEGKISKAPLISVGAEGVIAGIHIAQGQKVSRGDALFTMDAASSRHKVQAETDVVSPRAGVVSALYVQGGQQVMKDQLLMTVKATDDLEFVVDVDEMDILSVFPGQMMQVKADALGEERIKATVKEISPLGITVLDTTKYPVTLVVQNLPGGLLPGMHVTAYWE